MESLASINALSSNIIFFFVALIICAFFSFLETSISSVRVFMLKELAKTKKKYQFLLATMEDNPDKILSTILVAKNIADVTTAMLSGYIVDTLSQQCRLSENVSFFLSILFATVTILIFGEIIPKSIGKLYGEKLLPSNLWIINILYYFLYPLSYITKCSRFFIRKIDKYHSTDSRTISSEQEIQFLIEQFNEKGLIDPEKVKMLLNVFKLGNVGVRDIMVTKSEIKALNVQMTLKNALHVFSEFQLARMPVYDGEFDNMLGVVYQKDLILGLLREDACKLIDLVRPLLFIPTQIRLIELLREFKEQQTQMAVVINEFGSIEGLVTLEDIFGEIIGEMHDEHTTKIPKLLQVKPGGWLVDASIKLAKLSSLFPFTFEGSQATTLGGFLIELLHRLPCEGEQVVYKEHTFFIKKANSKQVLQVLITFDRTLNLGLKSENRKNEAEVFME